MASVQAQAQAQSLSLVAFIQGLGDRLDALFRHPYCVVSILRSLRPLSRQLLLRFACTGGDVSTGAWPAGSGWQRGPLGRVLEWPLLAVPLIADRGLRLAWPTHPTTCHPPARPTSSPGFQLGAARARGRAPARGSAG